MFCMRRWILICEFLWSFVCKRKVGVCLGIVFLVVWRRLVLLCRLYEECFICIKGNLFMVSLNVLMCW